MTVNHRALSSTGVSGQVPDPQMTQRCVLMASEHHRPPEYSVCETLARGGVHFD